MIPGFIKRLLRRRFGETTPLRRVLYLKNGETKVSKTEITEAANLPKVFDPKDHNIQTYQVPRARATSARAVEDYFVDDLRAGDDPSFAIVPRVTSYNQLLQYFNVLPRLEYGWQKVGAGRRCFKVVGFYLRSGPAAFIPKFLKEDGSPYPLVRVVLTWPGAPAPEAGEVYRPAYAVNGVAGWTNNNGDVGFGYGGGSMIAPGGAGPDMIWPLIPGQVEVEPQFADAGAQLGWMTNTNHLTVNPIFQIVEKVGETNPPPPPPPTDGNYIKVVVGGQVIGHIPILPPTTTGVNALEVYEDDVLIGKVVF